MKIGAIMKSLLSSAAIISTLGCSTGTKVEAPKGYHLVWNDEFDGKTIDSTKWDFQLGTGSQYGLTDWGNNEQEYYTDQNAFLEKGNLVIEARKESKEGKNYTSSRLRTMKEGDEVLFAKTYGRVEAKIKMPKGSGVWPAFWMLPATYDYGQWPMSGEIDIMEAKGRLANRVYGTVHFGQTWPGNKYTSGMYKFPSDSDITGYHVYALEWEPGLLRWLVDDEVFYETQQWWSLGENEAEPYKYPAPFDKPFYILLNLAIGGNYDDGAMPEDYELPAKMYVDYVRVYDKDEPYATNVKKPLPQRDTTSFESFAKSENDNFIFDADMTKVQNPPLSTNTMSVTSRDWYFLTLSEYEGKASSVADKIDGKSFQHVTIDNVGNQNYSIQLIQHLPVAEGYSYKIEFDAKSSIARKIAVKLGGDDDNSWAVYSPSYYPELDQTVKHYSYVFTMDYKTDKTARLEFNLGLENPDVWIGNVSVTQIDY